MYGIIRLPKLNSLGSGYCTVLEPHNVLPPMVWNLPPRDGKWYDCDLTPYGPITSGLKAGWIDSVRGSDTKEMNPCQHSQITGTSIYVDPDTDLRWTNSTVQTWEKSSSYTYEWAKDALLPPSSEDSEPIVSTPLMLDWGRPATVNNRYVYTSDGSKSVKVQTKSSGYDGYYWYYNQPISLAYRSERSLKALGLNRDSVWNWGDILIRRHSGIRLYQKGTLEWARRPETNTFIRTVSSVARVDQPTVLKNAAGGYSRGMSYTPFDSSSKAVYGNQHWVLAEQKIADHCKILMIRHLTGGQYQVRVEWRSVSSGMEHNFTVCNVASHAYGNFSHHTGVGVNSPSDCFDCKPLNGTYEGVSDFNIFIPEPGVAANIPSDAEEKLLDYCYLAPDTCRLMYDPSEATKARTRASDDVPGLSSNYIENFAGLKDAASILSPILEGYSAFKSGNIALALKALGSAYLVYKYAVAPTAADAQEVAKKGSQIAHMATDARHSIERRRGRNTVNGEGPEGPALLTYTSTWHLTLKGDNPFLSLWHALSLVGLQPSASQLWDLVPYSFVIDWFTKIGPTLRRCEDYLNAKFTYNLRGRCEGYKVSWQLKPSTMREWCDGIISAGTPLTYSWYDRRLYGTLGKINPWPITESSGGLSASQWMQAGALVTQRLV